jgi:8-oxo-dGTP pyrophosphatase MutT (NUDIX family)
MVDLDFPREGPTPRDASTLVVVRDAPGGGIEVFCVERQKVGFLAGAIVFPGGKLDASDLDPDWESLVTPPRQAPAAFAADAKVLRGLAIAACREALEEAAILPVTGTPPSHADLLDCRAELADFPAGLRSVLARRGLKLALGSLYPLAHWVTPVAQSPRFDTRFFLYVASDAVTGAHDDHETTASFWARPSTVLLRHESAELVLAPPTHRMLEILSAASSLAEAVAIASRACLDPICPRMVTHRDGGGDTVAVVLPGDPEHDVPVARVPGKSRFVFRGGRFFPEDPPT